MKISLKELAELCGGELKGDPSSVVEDAAPADKAGPTAVCYLEDISKKELLDTCRAGCVILPRAAKDSSLSYSGAAIYADKPKWAFTLFLRRLQLEKRPKTPWGVHPSAVVDSTAHLGKYVHVGPCAVIEKGASIGDFSVIGAHSYIGENVKVGANCQFYPHVTVREECSIGDKVILHPGVVVGADGFAYMFFNGRHEKIPQLGTVVIEDDVEIGANSTIDRAMLTQTRIGAGTKIDNLVQIAHNVDVGRACIIVAQTGIAGSCVLEDGVVVGGQAGLADHVRLGRGSMVAAQSGIMVDTKPGEIVFGSPARPRLEAMKIIAIMGKLPEMYAFFRKMKARFGAEEKK